MRFLLAATFCIPMALTSAAAAGKKCVVGVRSCPSGSYCASSYRKGVCPRDGECVQYLPGGDTVEVSLPIPAGERVYCAKGMLKAGKNTHSACDPATRFAIDLSGTAAERPHLVLASAPGTIKIFRGCQSFDLNRQVAPSKCNYGFGNVVRIRHAKGIYSQVAHLSSILVRDGATVKRGDVIGIEGNTGNAGAKHIHWSLHRGSFRVAVPGPSVPFDRIRIRRQGSVRVISSHRLSCGDFAQDPIPHPATLVESENAIGRQPSARFGFSTWFDDMMKKVSSSDSKIRSKAIGELREVYQRPVAPFLIALGYLRSGDVETAHEELRRAIRRAERNEGPPWFRYQCYRLLDRLKTKGSAAGAEPWTFVPWSPGMPSW